MRGYKTIGFYHSNRTSYAETGALSGAGRIIIILAAPDGAQLFVGVAFAAPDVAPLWRPMGPGFWWVFPHFLKFGMMKSVFFMGVLDVFFSFAPCLSVLLILSSLIPLNFVAH